MKGFKSVDDGGERKGKKRGRGLRESETERGPNVINTELYLNNCVEIFGQSILKKPGTICLKRDFFARICLDTHLV